MRRLSHSADPGAERQRHEGSKCSDHRCSVVSAAAVQENTQQHSGTAGGDCLPEDYRPVHALLHSGCSQRLGARAAGEERKATQGPRSRLDDPKHRGLACAGQGAGRALGQGQACSSEGARRRASPAQVAIPAFGSMLAWHACLKANRSPCSKEQRDRLMDSSGGLQLSAPPQGSCPALGLLRRLPLLPPAPPIPPPPLLLPPAPLPPARAAAFAAADSGRKKWRKPARVSTRWPARHLLLALFHRSMLPCLQGWRGRSGLCNADRTTSAGVRRRSRGSAKGASGIA